MPIVTHHDLKYLREDLYYQRLKPIYDDFRENNPAGAGLIAQDHANFYHLLSTALRIDKHPVVEAIKQTIYRQYDLDIPIHVFQFRRHGLGVLPQTGSFLRRALRKTNCSSLCHSTSSMTLAFRSKLPFWATNCAT